MLKWCKHCIFGKSYACESRWIQVWGYMFTNSNNTNFVMFLSSVGIGLGVSAQKMKSTKIRAQQKLIKLQYINGGWTNTESLISASLINEKAILWSWLYKNNTQILVCTKWFWHVFFPNMNLQYFTCKCTWISTE